MHFPWEGGRKGGREMEMEGGLYGEILGAEITEARERKEEADSKFR